MDLTEKFVGKSLDEIGSIPFEDILTSGPETCGNENRAESQAEVDAEHTSLECQAEVDAEHTSLDAPDGYGSMDEDDHTISNGDEEEFEGKRKRKPPKKAANVRNSQR
ncbi:hypothetical protein DPMN_028632 [Dreissena polymorpha]|uniref:Uncharacterized protein n=2 Tax=Dreissena polymorpha TaxID=45954 RepID=A0A9D4REJ2_DREPO|nr:hypothetical protein DPMN_028632 [Dreissena polymorpha]